MSLETIDDIKMPEGQPWQELRQWLFDNHAENIWNIELVHLNDQYELKGSLHSEKAKDEILAHLASIDPLMRNQLTVEGVFVSASSNFDYLL